MKYVILSVITCVILEGCMLGEGCEEIGYIDFSNNEYSVILSSSNEKIKVNEKINVLVMTPIRMTDTNGDERLVNPPNIWIRFTDQTNVEPLDSINVFDVGGETLHATFEEYFEQNQIIGETDVDLIFRHQAALIEDHHVLEIEYKVKQSGVYLIDIGYDVNGIIIEEEMISECINFVQPKLYWQDNPINRVHEYYSSDDDQSYRFVIEIEE